MTPEEFRAARERLGLTQEELADMLGLRKNTVWRKEKGLQAIEPRDELAIEALLARTVMDGRRMRPDPVEQAAHDLALLERRARLAGWSAANAFRYWDELTRLAEAQADVADAFLNQPQ
jgi:transcriptional regulator with XRE-family HTH domain